MTGVHTRQLAGHVDEYIWRERHRKSHQNAFDNLLLHISEWYRLWTDFLLLLLMHWLAKTRNWENVLKKKTSKRKFWTILFQSISTLYDHHVYECSVEASKTSIQPNSRSECQVKRTNFLSKSQLLNTLSVHARIVLVHAVNYKSCGFLKQAIIHVAKLLNLDKACWIVHFVTLAYHFMTIEFDLEWSRNIWSRWAMVKRVSFVNFIS